MTTDIGRAAGPESEASTRWLDATEMRAWRTFIDGHHRLIDVLNGRLQQLHGLTLGEYRILVMLSESPDGSLRMSSLAESVLSSRSKLTHQIARMQAHGMVERVTCQDDGRGVLAVITEQGRARLASAAHSHVDDVRRNLIDLLDENELRVLGDIFEKVDRELLRDNY